MPESDTHASRYRAPALEKGLDILELLAERPEGLTQADVARNLGRSVGEIFRMLNCLVERGYLTQQAPGDRYVLTLKLFELAHRHDPLARLLQEALPLVRVLTERVLQSCHVVVLHDDQGIVVLQADAPGEMGFAVRVGARVPLVSTASGRVLLAFQSDADRARLLQRLGVDAKEMERGLSRIRERGYEDIESSRIRGVHDYSYPVLNHRGAAVAALTVPLIARLDKPGESNAEAVRTALAELAKTLSRTLGGRQEA
jgi:DNA-binding IclR family transcriptional regulator